MALEQQPWVVCIIDDDESVARSFSRLLRSAGFDFRIHPSGESFLRELPEEGRACILMDITMPRMSGLELQARLKERGVHLPVIAVSARDDDVARSTARLLGASFFLHKPVDDNALLDAIARVTGAA